MAKETISVRLERDTLDRLSAIAKATGRTRGALLTHAIEQYVATEAWQVAAIQEAMDELDRGTADLVDHQEVAAWLNSWGTDNEADAPACR
jgi:predicted transcriptional regulator